MVFFFDRFLNFFRISNRADIFGHNFHLNFPLIIFLGSFGCYDVVLKLCCVKIFWGFESVVKFDFRPSELEKIEKSNKIRKKISTHFFPISHFQSWKKYPEYRSLWIFCSIYVSDTGIYFQYSPPVPFSLVIKVIF